MLGIIGAGTMGNGVAQVFASHGHDVVIADVNDEACSRAVGAIEKSLGRFVKKEEEDLLKDLVGVV